MGFLGRPLTLCVWLEDSGISPTGRACERFGGGARGIWESELYLAGIVLSIYYSKDGSK